MRCMDIVKLYIPERDYRYYFTDSITIKPRSEIQREKWLHELTPAHWSALRKEALDRLEARKKLR